MKTQDIRNMGLAYVQVLEAGKVNKHGHDHVGKEDDDVNNDKKVDSTDKYLLNRRKAISANMKKEDVQVDEALVGNQHKIDANKNGKVDAHDFKLLRGKKTQSEEKEEGAAHEKAEKKKKEVVAEKEGLWANIHAKRERIKNGSNERMRKPGSEGAPTKQDFVKSQTEEVEGLDELSKDTVRSYYNKAGEQGRKIAGNIKVGGGDWSKDGENTKTLAKRAAGRAMALKRRSGEVKMSEEVEVVSEVNIIHNGKKFKNVKRFDNDKEANDFLEKNPSHGVLHAEKGSVYVAHNTNKGVKHTYTAHNEEFENIDEGRASQAHPLAGHDYHKKSNDQLEYIRKDAHSAAEAMKDHNTTAENKYRDQASDASTVLHFRKTSGTPDWYKKKYGHMKESFNLDEISRDLATRSAQGFADKADAAHDKKDFAGFRKGEAARKMAIAKVQGRAKVSAVARRVEEVELFDEEADLTKIDTKRLQSMVQMHKHYGQKNPASKAAADRGEAELKRRMKKESVELDEAVNEKQIKKDLDSGMSHDVVIGKHANKGTTNTDAIRKVIKQHAWDKRMKKEEVDLDEATKSKNMIHIGHGDSYMDEPWSHAVYINGKKVVDHNKPGDFGMDGKVFKSVDGYIKALSKKYNVDPNSFDLYTLSDKDGKPESKPYVSRHKPRDLPSIGEGNDMDEAKEVTKKTITSKQIKNALASAKARAKPKGEVSLAKAPWKESSEWPIFSRINEKLKLPSYKVSGIGDDPHEVNVKYATDDKHTKGATPAEKIDSTTSKGEKDYIAKHGGLDGNESGIDVHKYIAKNSVAHTAGVKVAAGRPGDSKIGDKNIIKSKS